MHILLFNFQLICNNIEQLDPKLEFSNRFLRRNNLHYFNIKLKIVCRIRLYVWKLSLSLNSKKKNIIINIGIKFFEENDSALNQLISCEQKQTLISIKRT